MREPRIQDAQMPDAQMRVSPPGEHPGGLISIEKRMDPLFARLAAPYSSDRFTIHRTPPGSKNRPPHKCVILSAATGRPSVHGKLARVFDHDRPSNFWSGEVGNSNRSARAFSAGVVRGLTLAVPSLLPAGIAAEAGNPNARGPILLRERAAETGLKRPPRAAQRGRKRHK